MIDVWQFVLGTVFIFTDISAEKEDIGNLQIMRQIFESFKLSRVFYNTGNGNENARIQVIEKFYNCIKI